MQKRYHHAYAALYGKQCDLKGLEIGKNKVESDYLFE
jgi:hypothetical protein